MWVFLFTSHDVTNANENLANEPHSCLGLLANLEDILRSVDDRLIILSTFDLVFNLNTPFTPR